MIHIFIVNPYAGWQTFANDLRQKLADIKDLNYFVFNTMHEGHEAELVRLAQYIFVGEKLRFYCCGGAGTMRNILNAIESLESVEVAFFPCGLTNGFVKAFGKNSSRFFDIEELIYGDVIKLDYIKTNHGLAINTLSLGIDTLGKSKVEEYRRLQMFGKTFPYFASILQGVLFSKPGKYIVEINNEIYEDYITQLFFGNGNIIGGMLHFFESANMDDGMADYFLATGKKKSKLYKSFNSLRKKDWVSLHSNNITGKSASITVRRSDGNPFTMNLDGDICDADKVWEGQIINKGLNLVVPKGVTCHER